MSKIWVWLRRRFGHYRSNADLEEELKSHLEMEVEDACGRGITPGEARRRATLKLGSRRTIVERIRDEEMITLLESCYRDLMSGLRGLRRSPALSATAILTLALGIGANTAIFSLLDGLLLRSLPVSKPGELAYIAMGSTASQYDDAGAPIPYLMLQQLKREQHSFAGISAWDSNAVTMKDSEGTMRQYNVGLVSGNGFALLGVKPYLGRLIQPDDDVRGGPSRGWPVVLSYGFWKSRFGADPNVAGRSIRLPKTSVTVIGVTPPDFRGVWPGDEPKLYFPLQFATTLSDRDELNAPGSFYICSAIGRLKPGVSVAEAAGEVSVYQKGLLHEFVPSKFQQSPYFKKANLRVASARTGLPTYFGHLYSKPLLLMQGLVSVVLLLCCVNVGGLMLSKVYARQHEFAVRTAIGAARWRLARQYLTENLVVAVLGAALGGAAAWYGTPLLLHFFRDPDMFEAMSVRPSSAMFWETGLCALVTTLFFGALPAWRVGSADPGSLLKSRTTAGGRRQIAGRAFVPAQVALSLVLVALAGLLSESLIRLRGERTGFELDHVTIQTPPFNLLPQQGDARLDVYQRMLDRIEQMPGIRSAAVTWYTPMTGSQSTATFQALSNQPDPPKDTHMAYNAVGAGYFRTMETHIIAGREFDRDDRKGNVCLLNQSAANFLFPHQQPLGQYVRGEGFGELPNPASCRVIGVAEDAKFADLRQAPPRTLYFPLTKEELPETGNLVFLINSATEADAISGYRRALSEIAPTIPLVLFVTLRDQMDAALGSQRLITLMSNFFGGVALFLSAIGLYGLLASSVAQRTSEIGVRIALGAQKRAVLKMILSEAFSLLGAGVVLGVVALFVAVRFVRSLLYGVSSFDPVILASTIVLLTLVALAASAVPALRAASIDPIEALRAE